MPGDRALYGLYPRSVAGSCATFVFLAACGGSARDEPDMQRLSTAPARDARASRAINATARSLQHPLHRIAPRPPPRARPPMQARVKHG